MDQPALPRPGRRPGTPQLQAWLFPFTAAVAVVAMITAGARMALTRKATPLVDVGSGLLTIAITAAAGTLVPALLLKASDAYSTAVLSAATGGQFSARFAKLIAFGGVVGPGADGHLAGDRHDRPGGRGVPGGPAAVPPGRGIIILAGTLPLAAAGTMNPLTRPWFRKVTGWELALLFYKAVAATVYATGFALVGQGTSILDVLGGFAVLCLSIAALPVLLRFFNWAPGQLETGGGSGVLGSVIGGAAAVGALRGYGGGGSAADQARAMSMSAGPPGSSGGGSSPAGGSPRGPGGGPSSGGGPPERRVTWQPKVRAPARERLGPAPARRAPRRDRRPAPRRGPQARARPGPGPLPRPRPRRHPGRRQRARARAR